MASTIEPNGLVGPGSEFGFEFENPCDPPITDILADDSDDNSSTGDFDEDLDDSSSMIFHDA